VDVTHFIYGSFLKEQSTNYLQHRQKPFSLKLDIYR